jgi:hypothetical protein
MPTDVFRKWRRQTYLQQYAADRRAAAKAEGARRIDVTLHGAALDHYAVVRGHLEELNRFLAARSMLHPPTGLRVTLPPYRLSDPEVIRQALDIAAHKILEDEAEQKKHARAARE